MKQYKYKKIQTDVTTITLVEPDYELLKLKDRVQVIGELDGFTYVEVPDSITLPSEQPIILIEANYETDKINAQVVEKIRQKYSINDEIKLLRLGETPGKATWSKYVDDCRAWGTSAKEAIK